MEKLQKTKRLDSAIGSNKKPNIGITVLLMFGLLASGCSINHDYVWSEYAVKAERISDVSDFAGGSAVQVNNANPETPKIELAALGPHHYQGSYGQLTQAIVTQYTQELEKKGMIVRSDAPKSLGLEVTSHDIVRGAWVIQANMVLQVDMGNGNSKEIQISNTTGSSVVNLLNGAVSVAVTQLLNDEDVSEYLKN